MLTFWLTKSFCFLALLSRLPFSRMNLDHVTVFCKGPIEIPDGTEHPSYATTTLHRASPARNHSVSISGCHLAADEAGWLWAAGVRFLEHRKDPGSRTCTFVPGPFGSDHSAECPPRFCNPPCKSYLPGKHRYHSNIIWTVMNLVKSSSGTFWKYVGTKEGYSGRLLSQEKKRLPGFFELLPDHLPRTTN